MIEKNYQKYKIKIRNAKEMREENIIEYLEVFNNVFNEKRNFLWFKEKHVFNESIVLMCYDQDKCIGTQTFMRNDIFGKKAYQSCDSALLNTYQGKGIFKEMVRLGQEILGEKQYIYGFPNLNSLKTFKKLGWIIHEREKYEIIFRIPQNTIMIEDEYVKKILKYENNLFYIKRKNKYYLVEKKKKGMYILLGEVNYKVLNNAKQIRVLFLLKYDINGYLGQGIVPIENFPLFKEIPILKKDTLIG